ncbi:YlbF family regulator [Shouchella lehensis]|uniref:Regulatory protein n=2 Tax=Shouchella lehensis TaxID=300825 RepID=A0A060LXL2_9BACI|nr:YlbF family regulator [Shouchella lehensis]AIC94942.1 regulatory protein [Shouchella lehensis G1]MBG9784209.1 regulator [Shouchella lehensis]RQW20777.1 YlbF family regulator [Bacillus sp. C1-1]TES50801.1 YlbF family regulator [Shouchella lehensis]
MIATLDTVELLNASDELASIILQSELFSQYIEARDRLNQDKEAQYKIERFTTLKVSHEEVQRFGKYHPDFKTVSADIRMAKRELDRDESVVQFKKAETELEDLLNELSGVLASMVSPSIKVPTGNPFFDSMSCSGGCGSGGGCSCG